MVVGARKPAIHPNLGQGQILLVDYFHELELYHFTFNLSAPLALHAFNPEASDWLLLNINLSTISVKKTVNDKEVNIQKFLPSGILLYPPGTNVSSISSAHQAYEVVLVRFRKSWLNYYVVLSGNNTDFRR